MVHAIQADMVLQYNFWWSHGKVEALSLLWIDRTIIMYKYFRHCWYPFSRHIFYKLDSIKPDFLMGSINVLYYILFYSFKHGSSPCELLEKLRKCGLKGMGWFLSDLSHEPNTSVLPSGQGTLLASQAHERGLVPKIFTPKVLLCSGWLWPKVYALT